jgi:hypothetical protein
MGLGATLATTWRRRSGRAFHEALAALWRRALLILHVATSAGLMGAVAAFLLLASLAVAGGDARRPARPTRPWSALTLLLILPLAVAALVVGVVQSLVTSWGSCATGGCSRSWC